MQEVFEKIKESLEEDRRFALYEMNEAGVGAGLERAIEIVNQVAEECNDGWIPCSERLPEEKGDYLVTCNDGKARVWWFVVDGDFKRWLEGVNKLKPIAWQPLPEPYRPKGEQQ